jgi:hypothetical protein
VPQGPVTTAKREKAGTSMWPTGVCYNVALTDPNGNSQPSYPMQWQLIGPRTTINLSNGLP